VKRSSGRSTGRLCIILGYHEVAPLRAGMRRSLVVAPRTFASHLAYLRASGGTCVRLEDVALAITGEVNLPKRAFALTFDDGYVGNHAHALPLLRRFGCTATVFVPSALIGETGAAGASQPVDKMNIDQLRDVLNAGHSIGSHTLTHADLPRLSRDERREEIATSRRDLENSIGTPVTTFCYPFGRYDAETVEAVEQAGYELACTTEYGMVHAATNRYTVPRITVGDNLSLPHFMYRHWSAHREPVAALESAI
jgi:peptidoglycan/xylan/chitin deacetylase (PgdA/CDA1 family)